MLGQVCWNDGQVYYVSEKGCSKLISLSVFSCLVSIPFASSLPHPARISTHLLLFLFLPNFSSLQSLRLYLTIISLPLLPNRQSRNRFTVLSSCVSGGKLPITGHDTRFVVAGLLVFIQVRKTLWSSNFYHYCNCYSYYYGKKKNKLKQNDGYKNSDKIWHNYFIVSWV